jgi:Tfp pilus assembly protein PilX
MNKHGSIVFSLLLVLVLTMLGAALLLRSVNENKVASRTTHSAQAFWLAESGIQQTIWDINQNNCTGFVRQGTATACVACNNCGTGNKTMAVSVAGAGDYDVVMDVNNTTATSTGYYPSRTNAKKIQRRVQATFGQTSPFTYGVFAQGQVTLANNTFIDSYNSSLGNYDPVTNSGTNGDVGSNGTTAGIISIGSNISVGGGVSTATGGTVTVGNGTVITGGISTQPTAVTLTPVQVPASLTNLASGGTLSVAGNGTVNLGGGNYKYTNLNMGNNSTLNVTGNVALYFTGATSVTTGNGVHINLNSGGSLKVYVDGVLTLPNNVTFTNPGNKAENFQVYSTYTGTNGISIGNNGPLGVALYAPQTNVSIANNGDLYGSIIGKTVLVNNGSAIHFDETLNNLPVQVGTSGVASWQET